MNTKPQWFLIANDQEYDTVVKCYEDVKYAAKDSDQYKEKMLLVHLIAEYEKSI